MKDKRERREKGREGEGEREERGKWEKGRVKGKEERGRQTDRQKIRLANKLTNKCIDTHGQPEYKE